LRRASQDSNRKLRDLAAEVVQKANASHAFMIPLVTQWRSETRDSARGYGSATAWSGRS
jgi:hypothetical protein